MKPYDIFILKLRICGINTDMPGFSAKLNSVVKEKLNELQKIIFRLRFVENKSIGAVEKIIKKLPRKDFIRIFSEHYDAPESRFLNPSGSKHSYYARGVRILERFIIFGIIAKNFAEWPEYLLPTEQSEAIGLGLLPMSIEILELSSYIYKRLLDNGIASLGDLRNSSRKDLLKMEGLGGKRINEILEQLADLTFI